MMDVNRVYLEETVPVELIHALPASKVKTITYPGESEFSGPEFLPVPETTFECDALLAENLDKFIDDAKVKRCSSLQAISNYYFRKHSKIGNPEKENGLICKLKVTDNADNISCKLYTKTMRCNKT